MSFCSLSRWYGFDPIFNGIFLGNLEWKKICVIFVVGVDFYVDGSVSAFGSSWE